MDQLKLGSAWNAAFLKDEIVMELTGIHIQGALFEAQLAETQQSSSAINPAPNLCVAWISEVNFLIFYFNFLKAF